MIGTTIAKKAVATIETVRALSEGEPSQSTSSLAGADTRPPPWNTLPDTLAADVAPPKGKPHCGQLAAARETWALHSGQGTSAIGTSVAEMRLSGRSAGPPI